MFAHITDSERERLSALTDGLRTPEDFLAAFGQPDLDTQGGREQEGQPPTVELHRQFVYQHLSETAELWVSFLKDGVCVMLTGKYIGNPGPKET